MDAAGAQDDYEEQLHDLFNSFDAGARGSLSFEETNDLCSALHLQDAAPALLDALLRDQDPLTCRVNFDLFKNQLILLLSSNLESTETRPEPPVQPDSAEIQPKFMKGTKRYGRRSTPEFIQTPSDSPEAPSRGDEPDENDESAIPRKRERWNADDRSSEEFEAEGQMHLWNPDEPSTPQRPPLCGRLQERLRDACLDLNISWDGCADPVVLLALCERLGLEINGDVVQNVDDDEVMNVQEFVSNLVNHNKPPTPSSSTPYRQLKRLHSTQPFDDDGRRTANPSALTCSIGTSLFSGLDDGSGFAPVDLLVDAWSDEGIENSSEILQALNFDLDAKLSLGELAAALEHELLGSRNGIHQAAAASFKAEIRFLLERVDRESREKLKLRTDLDKAEKLKSQLAAEVDEHHSSIEQNNILNLRRLDQEHREKLTSLRAQLNQEMEQTQQQAALMREELEAEIHKFKDDESFLRDHLSITIKENRRLEMELLESSERMMEMQDQVTKLQTSLENVLTEKFGDLDPCSAEFFLQEERMKQLRLGYEAQCRELQDRIDELQSELQDRLAPNHPSCHRPLSEELESKSPGVESDPGIGSEDVHPFSLSLEAEMKLEQLREQHSRDMEALRNQLENKINVLNKTLETQGSSHQHQDQVQGLREQVSTLEHQKVALQSQLEQAELERHGEKEEEDLRHQEVVEELRRQLREAEDLKAGLEEQMKTFRLQEAEVEELKGQRAGKVRELEEELLEMQEKEKEKMAAHGEEKKEFEKRLLESSREEKKQVQQQYEEELKEAMEKARCEFEEAQDEKVRELKEQWQEERARLDEQNNELLQGLLAGEMLRLVQEQEEKEKAWEGEKKDLQQQHKESLLGAVVQERLQLQEQSQQREARLRQEWEKERLQLEDDYEAMLQERLSEEREKMDAEKEELENALERLLREEKARLEERHQEALEKLTGKHSEERSSLSLTLSRLREDIVEESSKNKQLAGENQTLRKKIVVLQEEDLKEKQDELIHAQEELDREKIVAQKAEENFSSQISELRLQSQNLEKENLKLSEKNSQNVANVEKLKLQLTRVKPGGPRDEGLNSERQRRMLDDQKSVSRKTRSEKAKASDETLQAVNKQNARLKSDLSAVQYQRDSLRHEVALLNKRLQSEKSSPQIQSRKLVLKPRRDSKPAVKKQEDLRHDANAALEPHARQSSLVKTLEQENAALKQELRSRKEVIRNGENDETLEKLKLENEELKEQLSRANCHALEAFQSHFLALLPSSPHRQPRAEDPENAQDERERGRRESRLKEMEKSLLNVKVMLREKVAQLNEQVQQNGQAGALVSDLYAENTKLLKVLEATEQRLKRTEKMNFLLEEKISSLNKILRRLNPVNLSLMSHHSQ